MSTAAGRTKHAEAILGPELHTRLSLTKVLVVGAGGIGCELLKTLVLTGFTQITLLDLDTIDLSNLNRQFLFRTKDVKKPKSITAARAASSFNPNVKIDPIFGNIKAEEYDIDWFKGFGVVLNALDNLDARRHVNRMCMAAGVPLVESGTAGYLGQVQPLVKDATECFDCIPKPTPKSFPVCTIRSTPSQPIHCIVWSKSYLMGQLFGRDEDAGETSELDEAENNGENVEEIANLRKEAQSFSRVRAAIRSYSPNSTSTADQNNDPAKLAFQKIFSADIQNLLNMGDMWKHREPPVPLDYDQIISGTFILDKQGSSKAKEERNRINGASSLNGTGNKKTAEKVVMKDQRKLTLKENLMLFNTSVQSLSMRLSTSQVQTIEFDKDDEDTLDFVTAASNLRSAAYGIEGKSKWEVKEMAGNIIPAIATTNAIIAGLIVLQALNLLRASPSARPSPSEPVNATTATPSSSSTVASSASADYSLLRNVHIQLKPSVPLSSVTCSSPNPNCGVCRDVYTLVRCDRTQTTLRDVVQGVLGWTSGQSQNREGAIENGQSQNGNRNENENGSNDDDDEVNDGSERKEISVYEDKRILVDPDWDDNLDRTLDSLNVGRGKFISIVDEEGDWETVQVVIGELPASHPSTASPYILPCPLPKLVKRKKIKPLVPSVPSTPPPRLSLKRSLPTDADDGDVMIIDGHNGNGRTRDGDGEGQRALKKPRLGAYDSQRDAKTTTPTMDLTSPSKRKRLEEDGLVLMDGPGEVDEFEEDVIVIDDD
ncbi:hypothetical protein GGU11DRAFT_809438 [Lentinula aff. detonsa]|uniref:Ubiquitin-activating enzyme E1-like n=1 Tax=Lentinula detonsa TaxID=2804962 RepID=A0AA38UNL1_9AGAR|nr:hypothetical protein GGU11DRAFT_809438 [Lentinula aff. detonsa]KAJ3979781.1 hypothetical protein F5890DRAFT_1575891 [Lentinula detonsa]